MSENWLVLLELSILITFYGKFHFYFVFLATSENMDFVYKHVYVTTVS